MSAPEQAGTEAVVAMARALETDGATGELVAALRAEGIRSVLLKGPVLAAWLYSDGAQRTYVDADLLVSPDLYEAAAAVVARQGFTVELPTEGTDPEGGPIAAQPFGRPGSHVQVDLHRTLPAASAPPSQTWRVIGALTEPMTVGSVEVEAPRLPLRALIVALHAAQHGSEAPKPLRDLERAIAAVSYETWEEALAIADELEAVPALAMGLRLRPEGAEVAGRLGLASADLVDLATRQGSHARVVLGVKRLAEEPTAAGKASLLARELFPSPDFMRWRSGLARRGLPGLAAAYVARIAWLLWHATPSARAWLRNRADQDAAPAATSR